MSERRIRFSDCGCAPVGARSAPRHPGHRASTFRSWVNRGSRRCASASTCRSPTARRSRQTPLPEWRRRLRAAPPRRSRRRRRSWSLPRVGSEPWLPLTPRCIQVKRSFVVLCGGGPAERGAATLIVVILLLVVRQSRIFERDLLARFQTLENLDMCVVGESRDDDALVEEF